MSAITRCKICGNTDINKMIVHFLYLTPNGEVALDATTLPKFLFELKHPEKPKIRGAGIPKSITEHRLTAIKIREITCDECLQQGRDSVKIEPTRHGV